jgi:hypothetical protein
VYGHIHTRTRTDTHIHAHTDTYRRHTHIRMHTQELRRGADPAVVHSLAFSRGCEWLAVSSDKSTVHVFALGGSVATGLPIGTSPSGEVKRRRFSVGTSPSGEVKRQRFSVGTSPSGEVKRRWFAMRGQPLRPSGEGPQVK